MHDTKRGKTLSQAIGKICEPIFSNFYGASLFLNWNSVVGVKLASVTRPSSISSDKKTMTILVDRRSLLFVQYQTEFILEQIHRHLSDYSIQRIKIRTYEKREKNAK